jgi:hypothetical protein
MMMMMMMMIVMMINFTSSASIVRAIKSRRIRQAGHVARIGERKGVYRVLVGKPEIK